MASKKIKGLACSMALAVSVMAIVPLLAMANDDTPWQPLNFSDAVSQKVYSDSGEGGMVQKAWAVSEVAILNGLRPENNSGELNKKDAAIIFHDEAGIRNFKMTYVSTLDIPGKNVFEFQVSADGNAYEAITMADPVFVKNGFHSNPNLSTYVEQQAFTSADLTAKNAKYLKVIRKGSDLTADFPVITEMFLNGTQASNKVDLSTTQQMVSGGLKEQAWVAGDAGVLNGMRPDNDGVLNKKNAEVIFKTDAAIGQVKFSFVSTTDNVAANDFKVMASVDGVGYTAVTMKQPVVLNDNVKLDGYIKQYEIESEDILTRNCKYFKIIRQGSAATEWFPAINQVSVKTPELKDVVTYEPLTAEEGETVITDQLDAKDNTIELTKLNNLKGVKFDTSVFKNRDYFGLNFSAMNMAPGAKTGFAIYRADGMQRFKYTYISSETATAPTLKAYISKDGIQFEAAEVTVTPDATRTGDYKRYNVVNKAEIPDGIHYLKLEFTAAENSQDNYETAVGMVSIAHKPETTVLKAGSEQALLSDNFEPPFTLSFAKENLTYHPGTAVKLKEGQMYMRQEITGPSYIIYKAQGMSAFEVDTNMDPTNLAEDFAPEFYVSATGEDDSWVKLENVSKRLGSTAGNIDWLDYLYAGDQLPANSNFLKIEIPELEVNNYDFNLCSVKIVYSTKKPVVPDDNKPTDPDDDKKPDDNNSSNPETGAAVLPAALLLAPLGAAGAVVSKKRSHK